MNLPRQPPDIDFEWDNENVSHLARHHITPAEAEEVFRSEPVLRGYEVSGAEDRWTAVGATRALRVLVLIFAVREERIRVVTGWDASKQTKKQYFEERGTS